MPGFGRLMLDAIFSATTAGAGRRARPATGYVLSTSRSTSSTRCSTRASASRGRACAVSSTSTSSRSAAISMPRRAAPAELLRRAVSRAARSAVAGAASSRARLRARRDLLAPLIAPYDPAATDFSAVLAHPSPAALLGADELGRDVFSRISAARARRSRRACSRRSSRSCSPCRSACWPATTAAGSDAGHRARDRRPARVPVPVVAVGLAAILGPSLRNATIALGIGAAPAVDPRRARRGARAARGGLRPRRGRERRRRPAILVAPRAPEHGRRR